MADRKTDAAFGYLVQMAMDMFLKGGVTNLAPAADPRLTEWSIRGYLIGQDALLRRNGLLQKGPLQLGVRVCYGFLAESRSVPGFFVIVIRGTATPIEWFEDAQFAQVPHPVAGKVEVGFWGLYQTLQMDGLPAARAIAAAIGKGTITVVGHSLGAALATYLALDLAVALGARVSARIFASPRPGNADFAAAFHDHLTDYVVYANELDLVPRVPFGLGYCPVPNVTALIPGAVQARIRLGLECAHHILCYCAMLDYELLDWSKVPVLDASCAACVKAAA